MRLLLPAVALLALLVSAVHDRARTMQALRIAVRRLLAILPAFLAMLSLASVVLALVSPETLTRLASDRHLWLSAAAATAVGSVALLPGFVAFPLAGILVENGVPYTVIAAFTVSLMLVGVATFPVERAYCGTRVALVRNTVCVVIALIIAVVVGLVFGEIR